MEKCAARIYTSTLDEKKISNEVNTHLLLGLLTINLRVTCSETIAGESDRGAA